MDYVNSDDGDFWISPSRFDDIGFRGSSLAADLVRALHSLEIDTPTGLLEVANIWEGFAPEDETHWHENEKRNLETVRRLKSAGHTPQFPSDEVFIRERWTFPLARADLSRNEVDMEKLRDTQRVVFSRAEAELYGVDEWGS